MELMNRCSKSFYCILCDNSFRTRVLGYAARHLHVATMKFRAVAKLFSANNVCFKSTASNYTNNNLISADLKIAVALVVINIF